MVSRSAAVEEYFQPRVVAPADFLRGHRRRGRAVPARVRRDEAEAAARAGDPRERAGRADPRALARGPRLDARLDERRQEPLGGRVAAVAAVRAVLGAARARAHAPEEAAGVRHAGRDRPRRRATCARCIDAIGGGRRVPERPRRVAVRRGSGGVAATGRRPARCRCRRPRRAATRPTSRSTATGRSCSTRRSRRPADEASRGATRRRPPSPRASATSPTRTRASTSRSRRTSIRSRALRPAHRRRTGPDAGRGLRPGGRIDSLPRGSLAALRRRRRSRSFSSTCLYAGCGYFDRKGTANPTALQKDGPGRFLFLAGRALGYAPLPRRDPRHHTTPTRIPHPSRRP